MYMRDWIAKLDDFLRLSEREILSNAGTISHKTAELHAAREFQKYDDLRLQSEADTPSHFDHVVTEVKQLAAAPKAPQPRRKVPFKRRSTT